MDITPRNIGDVLCLYATAECVRITDIKGHHIYYDREYGSSYMTPAQTADAFVVTDPDRLAVFSQNCDLGKVLLHAELAAMNDLLSSDCTDQELEAAGKSLDTTRRHQHALFTRIDAYRATWTAGIPHAHAYLADLARKQAASLFWGIPVSHTRSHAGKDLFYVNGNALDHQKAATVLGLSCYREPERKMHLDGQIRSARSRRGQNPFEPAGRTEHQYTR